MGQAPQDVIGIHQVANILGPDASFLTCKPPENNMIKPNAKKSVPTNSISTSPHLSASDPVLSKPSPLKEAFHSLIFLQSVVIFCIPILYLYFDLDFTFNIWRAICLGWRIVATIGLFQLFRHQPIRLLR
jgi:hypothetical protein